MSTAAHFPRDPILAQPSAREIARSMRARLRTAGVGPSAVPWPMTSDDLPHLAGLLGVSVAELVTVRT